MRRREFIAALGGAAAAWPLAARAQQPTKLPTIGFLGTTTLSAMGQWVAAFVQRLRELGWIEGRNIAIEYRWAETRSERYDEIAAELVQSKVDVIVTTAPAFPAVQRATSVIPIVFALSADPVAAGFIASLARPGGNATGLSTVSPDTAGKRLELLREIVPGIRRLAVMVNLGFPDAVQEGSEAHAAASALGLEVVKLEIRRPQDIASSFESLKADARLCHHRRALQRESDSYQYICPQRSIADDLPVSGTRRSGGPDVIWDKYSRPVPTCCRLC
jgi:putative ABC transport system substrate-binding protein